MMRLLLCFLVCILSHGLVEAQSTAYVFQFGPTAGLQKWDNSSGREPLFQYHGAISMEGINNEDPRGSFYMQLGYHVKGSATRYRFFNINSGAPSGTATERFKFNNFSLAIGFKQRFKENSIGTVRYFYMGGLRGDYTYSTNIDELAERNSCNPGYYPFMVGVQRWMGGFTVGGGIELDFSELVGAQVQLTVNPDVTPQYRSNAVNNVIDTCFNGPNFSIPERRIRNTTVELSIGLRLLRKVVVVD
ncbi:MAG: hypothetical protein J0M29_09535 [Chitinophagales bacterium]|nr:hypothetical protein [Chitinophagales bacterium]